MIPRLVLDASVVLTCFLNATEEQTRYADAIAALIERDATICVVPGLWHIEVGTLLLKRRSAKEPFPCRDRRMEAPFAAIHQNFRHLA